MIKITTAESDRIQGGDIRFLKEVLVKQKEITVNLMAASPLDKVQDWQGQYKMLTQIIALLP